MDSKHRKPIEEQIQIDRLNKTVFFLPQKIKADFIVKLQSEGISSQEFFSGLILLWLDGREEIGDAVKSINKVVKDYSAQMEGRKTVGVIRTCQRVRKSLISPMSTEELANFFDFTENELEKDLSEED